MEDNDRFDALMKLADFFSGRHDARREFEWKVTLGLWAVILGAISYHEKLHWPRVLCLPIIPLASVMTFIIYYRFWLRPLWTKNVLDRDQAFDALEQAKKVLINAGHEPVFRSRSSIDVSWCLFLKDWSMFFQAIATALLLVVFCVIAWFG